ncbi:MAG: hypothetical protein U1D35_12795, partial [Paracoccaceae bacterium]|nr:hypothetical protein [Paracoccaceae bacterium]
QGSMALSLAACVPRAQGRLAGTALTHPARWSFAARAGQAGRTCDAGALMQDLILSLPCNHHIRTGRVQRPGRYDPPRP